MNHNMSGKINNNSNSAINKKTYLFATSSNEMAFPNSMPPAMTMMSARKIENYNNKQISNNDDYSPISPILIRKISKKKKEHRRKTNLEIWGNAARYKGMFVYIFVSCLFTFLVGWLFFCLLFSKLFVFIFSKKIVDIFVSYLFTL